MNTRTFLVPLDGSKPIEVGRDVTVVGRREDCDLRLDHKSVSKLHCVIVKTEGLLLLRDLGSTNGTRVNGQRIRRAALLQGDKVMIAHLSFCVAMGPVEPKVSPEEMTQAMDTREAAQFLEKANGDEEEGDFDDPPQIIQANQLPDVYQEEEKKAR